VADAQKVIELVFKGVDQTGAATQAALKNLQSFSGSMGEITRPVADFTAATVKLEAGLLAAGAAITAYAVSVAGDFDTSFRQLSTIIDATDGDLARFRDAILSYAQGSSKPLEDIMSALSEAIGQGVDYSQSLSLIGTAEKLAVATRADLTSTTTTLVSTMRAYGMETSEAGRVADLFAKTIDDGKIGMEDFAASFAKIAPVASVAGVSLEEVLSAVAVLTATGMKPAESIEYLRGAISNILAPSKQASELAQQLGIQFDANGLKANGLAGTLNAVAKATGGSADKMKILFSDVGAFTAAATLAGSQLGAFNRQLLDMDNAAGTVDAMVERMTGNFEAMGEKINNALKVVLIGIGTPLLDEFGGMADGISRILGGVAENVRSGQLGGLVAFVEGIAQDIESTLQAMARNLPEALQMADLSGFKDGITDVLDAIRTLFGNINLSTPEGLASAITTLGDAFHGLSAYVAGVIESFQPMFDLLVKIGSGAVDADTSLFHFGGVMGGVASQINLLLPMFEGLLAMLIVKEAGGIAGAAAKAAAGLTSLSSVLTSGGLVAGAGAAGYALGTILNDGINKIVQATTESGSLGSWIYDLVHGTDELAASTTAAGQAASSYVDSSAELRERLRGIWEGTGEAAQGFDDLEARMNEQGLVWDVLTQSWLSADAALDAAIDGEKRLAQDTQAATNAQRGYVTSVVNGVTVFEQYGGALAKTSSAISDAAKKTEDATKKSETYMLKMEELASNERIKYIEATVAINTAQIDADVRYVEAAFESINTTINSTGDLIGSLFGAMNEASSYDKIGIQDQIEEENRRRQEALELQKELTMAQIEAIRARTEQMQRGDALIKVDGAGLQPHLEAFMWEILRAVQVRVNQDGLEMLLGV